MSRFLAVLSVFGVLAFGMVAVGCGGSDDGSNGSSGDAPQSAPSESDDAAIRELATNISKSMEAGNAKGFCQLFEPGQLEDWVGEEQCVKIFSSALKNAPKNIEYDVKDIKVDGDKGTLDLGFGSSNVVRIDGQWYLETPETNPPAETTGE